jgi:hypothetical protein
MRLLVRCPEASAKPSLAHSTRSWTNRTTTCDRLDLSRPGKRSLLDAPPRLIPGSQIDHASHISEWVRRNRLALQFQQGHPDQIALARYEDCSTDPMVFRHVAAWLGVKGQPLFRQDRAQGRRHLSRAAQQNIDLAVSPTLKVDGARTFSARATCRGKLAAATLCSICERRNVPMYKGRVQHPNGTRRSYQPSRCFLASRRAVIWLDAAASTIKRAIT